MIIVGICGASGSGKSTLAEGIKAALKCKCCVIGLDWYYYDFSHLPFSERTKINYDSPSIFNFDELCEDIGRLAKGQSITQKGYNYAEHRRQDTDNIIEPPDVLILEGIHIFYDDRLREMFDLKVYMHVDIDVCVLRRVQRDMVERGRTMDNIMEQYLATVKPMYDKYISRYISLADFAVMSGGMNYISIDAIVAYLHEKLRAES
jgi:uridine kinase